MWVFAMIETGADIHALRDLTRGGLVAGLCELAEAGHVGVRIDETAVPVDGPVRAACSFLGLDPFAVANEGTLVAFVGADDAGRVLERMRLVPEAANAVVIGDVVDTHPGTVVALTSLGGTRVVLLPLGEQLPRIC